MFTGIIQACCPVVAVTGRPGLTRFSVQFPDGFLSDLTDGASISIDGVCMTVEDRQDDIATFAATAETLRLTTLGSLQIGRRVNTERSARIGAEVGGHNVTGHVMGIAEIIRVENPENNHKVTFQLPRSWGRYLRYKDFITLDGTSLTIVDLNPKLATFTVWFIPETLARTTFGFKGVGDQVNFEINSQTQAVVDLANDNPVYFPASYGGAMESGSPRICIIAAEFNSAIVDPMIEAASAELAAANAVLTGVIRVPGAYEIPVAANSVLQRGDVEALIVLGYIERGETLHGEVMGHVVHRSIVDMQLRYDRPIGIGIIGPGATKEQAQTRNLGYAIGATRGVLKMVQVLSNVTTVRLEVE